MAIQSGRTPGHAKSVSAPHPRYTSLRTSLRAHAATNACQTGEDAFPITVPYQVLQEERLSSVRSLRIAHSTNELPIGVGSGAA